MVYAQRRPKPAQGYTDGSLPTRAQDWGLAIASGILLTLSFPKFGHPAIAWIALTPLLVALAGRVSMPRAFGLGLLAGATYLGGTLYWLSDVMARYGSINTIGAIAINVVFVAYLALYPALFAVIMRRLMIAFGASALAAAPFVWTATELGRTYVFTGFPWVLLGYSQATVLPIAQALELAKQGEMDLVEVAAEAVPPVCRIMDFGKYKYMQARRQKDARKKQTIIQVKEVKLGPKTDTHDFDFKAKHVRRFLEEGNKAKVTVRFKGREMAHTELGWKMLNKMTEIMADMAIIESHPRMEGRMLSMILSPKPH